MGTTQHHAVIATTWNSKIFNAAVTWIDALELDERGLFIVNSYVIVNEFHTIVLTTDGSKEGWEDSRIGDDLRTRFMDHLETYNNEDGSNPFDYIEVNYGDLGAELLRTNTLEDER